jgi:hypothetical protein
MPEARSCYGKLPVEKNCLLCQHSCAARAAIFAAPTKGGLAKKQKSEGGCPGRQPRGAQLLLRRSVCVSCRNAESAWLVARRGHAVRARRGARRGAARPVWRVRAPRPPAFFARTAPAHTACAPRRAAMRNDEDEPEASRDWLAEVQELLLTGGYFRARISNLAPFDKARVCAAWAWRAGAERTRRPSCAHRPPPARPRCYWRRAPGCLYRGECSTHSAQP